MHSSIERLLPNYVIHVILNELLFLLLRDA